MHQTTGAAGSIGPSAAGLAAARLIAAGLIAAGLIAAGLIAAGLIAAGLVVPGVVALDQAADVAALLAGERVPAGRAVDQGQQVAGGRADPDRQVLGGADPGPAVGQDDDALDRDRLATCAQEPLQVAGRSLS